jgi:hypothetical protein
VLTLETEISAFKMVISGMRPCFGQELLLTKFERRVCNPVIIRSFLHLRLATDNISWWARNLAWSRIHQTLHSGPILVKLS